MNWIKLNKDPGIGDAVYYEGVKVSPELTIYVTMDPNAQWSWWFQELDGVIKYTSPPEYFDSRAEARASAETWAAQAEKYHIKPAKAPDHSVIYRGTKYVGKLHHCDAMELDRLIQLANGDE